MALSGVTPDLKAMGVPDLCLFRYLRVGKRRNWLDKGVRMMVKLSEAEIRRQMEEILRNQLARPTLRPSDEDEAANNPFKMWPHPTEAEAEKAAARAF